MERPLANAHHAPRDRSAWRRRVAALVAAVLVAVVPASALAAPPRRGLEATFVDLAVTALAGAVRAVAPSSVEDGADDRLTFLLVGSDKRTPPSTVTGERLDVILVASLDRASDKVAMASVPRDTVRFPKAARNGGGTSGTMRVNDLYSSYRTDGDLCPGTAAQKRACAMARFRDDVETALHVDIDHWAYIRFEGFDALVDEIGGVRVDTPGAIVDKGFMDEPTLPKGVHFPDADDYDLAGGDAPRCLTWQSTGANASPDCHRAIVYVRSRKGTEGTRNNNDYRRALRQQDVVMAAVSQVIGRGDGEGGPLSALLAAMTSQADAGMFATDVPLTWTNALDVYGALSGATRGKRAVFAPSTYATVESTSTIRLRLSAVRAWVDEKLSPQPPS